MCINFDQWSIIYHLILRVPYHIQSAPTILIQFHLPNLKSPTSSNHQNPKFQNYPHPFFYINPHTHYSHSFILITLSLHLQHFNNEIHRKKPQIHHRKILLRIGISQRPQIILWNVRFAEERRSRREIHMDRI